MLGLMFHRPRVPLALLLLAPLLRAQCLALRAPQGLPAARARRGRAPRAVPGGGWGPHDGSGGGYGLACPCQVHSSSAAPQKLGHPLASPPGGGEHGARAGLGARALGGTGTRPAELACSSSAAGGLGQAEHWNRSACHHQGNLALKPSSLWT